MRNLGLETRADFRELATHAVPKPVAKTDQVGEVTFLRNFVPSIIRFLLASAEDILRDVLFLQRYHFLGSQFLSPSIQCIIQSRDAVESTDRAADAFVIEPRQ